uniref:FXYD domain-containing ion transport regulator n=1 Tax=Scophthalmus maximus TaxID=52904 RepID=A0A8D2ZEF9_SCOMX
FFAEKTMSPDRSDFDYDYETLRTTGVILAVIMFVSGILIALSKFRLWPSSSGTQIPKTEGKFAQLQGNVSGHLTCVLKMQ